MNYISVASIYKYKDIKQLYIINTNTYRSSCLRHVVYPYSSVIFVSVALSYTYAVTKESLYSVTNIRHVDQPFRVNNDSSQLTQNKMSRICQKYNLFAIGIREMA